MSPLATSQCPTLLQRAHGTTTGGKTMPKPSAVPRTEGPIVVAMFNVAMVGHVNPTYALVQELVMRGCKVHYFLPPNVDIRAAAREAGAVVEGYMPDDPDDFTLEDCGDVDGLPPQERYSIWPLASTCITSKHIVSRCRELGVRIVVYDPMAPHGLLVAKALRVPKVSLVTYPGLGSVANLITTESVERGLKLRGTLSKQLEEVEEHFNISLGSSMLSRLQWLSEDANFVTTSAQLEVPMPVAGFAAWADEVHENFSFTCVGSMCTAHAPHVTSAQIKKSEPGVKSCISNDIPKDELQAAAACGTRLIYVALGTMALAERWAADLGTMSGGNLPPGCTGKAFCQHIWKTVLEAMRELGDGYHCVICVGHQEDALDFLEGACDEDRLAALPSNVMVRTSVQQVEMLSSYTHAFVSHAGFNSLQESLIAGVPLIAVPQAVDQPTNARNIETNGWGRAFLEPMRTVTASELVRALRDVASETCSYRAGAVSAGAKLCGGQVRAADRLLAMCEV